MEISASVILQREKLEGRMFDQKQAMKTQPLLFTDFAKDQGTWVQAVVFELGEFNALHIQRKLPNSARIRGFKTRKNPCRGISYPAIQKMSKTQDKPS